MLFAIWLLFLKITFKKKLLVNTYLKTIGQILEIKHVPWYSLPTVVGKFFNVKKYHVSFKTYTIHTCHSEIIIVILFSLDIELEDEAF